MCMHLIKNFKIYKANIEKNYSRNKKYVIIV